MIQEQSPKNKLQQNQQYEEQFIGQWHLIPESAFLFFPKGEEIIVGEKEKQWRKIFENGEGYTEFQEQNLALLEKKIKQYKLQIDPWFTKANKLRFLQAQKFKISETCTSIKEACHWRKTDFPLKIDHRVQSLLKSGCAYFCGRDEQYRPILIVDIQKFKSQDQEFIPGLLMIMIQFMIGQLLIEGQVQNYILIMDLSQFSMSMKSTVTKILSFTSNTYRGRLFASYLLGMPGMLKFGWDAIASKFVSQNTLKKIKISKESTNPLMWAHIDRQRIQQKFGGLMNNIKEHFWPPSASLLNWKIAAPPTHIQHISAKEYQHLYLDGKLKGRKILVNYIHHIRNAKKQQLQAKIQQEEDISILPLTNRQLNSAENQKMHSEQKKNRAQKEKINEYFRSSGSKVEKRARNSQITALSQDMIKKQLKITVRERNFQLFFASSEFLTISKVLD